jgi:hypothetical protein
MTACMPPKRSSESAKSLQIGGFADSRDGSPRRSPRQEKPCKRAEYGANRDRTGDLLLAKQALSQLSYGPEVL